MSHVILHLDFFLQSGEASRWRVCNQQELPCQVLIQLKLVTLKKLYAIG